MTPLLNDPTHHPPSGKSHFAIHIPTFIIYAATLLRFARGSPKSPPTSRLLDKLDPPGETQFTGMCFGSPMASFTFVASAL